MTGKQFRDCLGQLGLTQAGLARALGVTDRGVFQYATGCARHRRVRMGVVTPKHLDAARREAARKG